MITTTQPNDIRHYVESPALPRPQAFYAQRRELRQVRPLRAFAIGAALGGLATAIVFFIAGILTA